MRAAVLVLALVAGTAAADDKVLVLRSEGRADKKVRARVEAAVLKLAQGTGEQTTAGDITYGDAAAMVGCKPEEDKCKDEVLGMLAVDEIVTISSTPKPGGTEVAVRRIGKGGATKSAQAVVAPEKLDDLEAIAPLFGKDGPPSPLPPPVTPPLTPTSPPMPPPNPNRSPNPSPVPSASPSPVTPAPSPSPSPIIPPPTRVAEPTNSMTPIVEPHDEDEHPNRRRRLAMIGMAGGGASLLVGVIFWASAKSVESEIADAPRRTKADLQNLRDLEDKGDTYATVGNVLVVTGVIVGGVSTYFFIKSRKHADSRSARITPLLLQNGGGLAVTWGGTP